MTQYKRIAIDTSKAVFTLHGIDQQDRPVLRINLRRAQMIPFFTKLPRTEIGMEACGRRLIPLTQVALHVVVRSIGSVMDWEDEQPMARARSLSEFQKEFSNEARCGAFLFNCRWPGGFVCPACGNGRGVALKSRPRLFECLACGRQTSITAGTVMHRSKLPQTTWFWAAHLMATHSNGMSARQLEDQLSTALAV